MALNIRDWKQGKNSKIKADLKKKIKYYRVSIAEKLEFLLGKRWKTPQWRNFVKLLTSRW